MNSIIIELCIAFGWLTVPMPTVSTDCKFAFEENEFPTTNGD